MERVYFWRRPDRAYLTALVLLCSLLSACPNGGVVFDDDPFPVTASAYKKIIHRWTKEAELYEGPQTRVFITATYSSWEFHEGVVALLSRD